MNIVDKLKSKILNGSAGKVYRGMFTLMLGTGMARLLGVASIPLLTRIYNPEAFGALSVFNSFVIIIAPILTLRYVMGIPLPRSNVMAANLVALCFLLIISILLAFGLILAIFSNQLLSLFSASSIAGYWPLIIIGLFLLASYDVGLLWATRQRAYGITAQSQALQSLVGEGAKVALGIAGLGSPGLIIGHVIAFGGGISMMIIKFWKDLRDLPSKISVKRMLFAGAYYTRFPKYRLPSRILLDGATQAPLLLTAAIYDVNTTGQLSLAFMAIALPISLLGNTMGNAYFAEASSIGPRKPAQLLAITISVVRTLFVVSIIPSLALFLFGEEMFSIAFGEQWREAGSYSSILSLYLLSQFVCAPVTRIFSILNMEHVYLFVNLQRAVFVALSFIPGIYFSYGISSVLILFSVSLSVHRIVVLAYIFLVLRSRAADQRVLK